MDFTKWIKGAIPFLNRTNNKRFNLPTYENKTGEGVVSFQAGYIFGGENGFYSHLLVNGEQIFEFGCPCGTCGILFRRVGSPANRINDFEAVELLGDLQQVPPDNILQLFTRILEPGTYHPMVIEGNIQLIEPGSKNDYFATDVVRLFGFEPPEYEKPAGPWTTYYRFGSDGYLKRTGRTTGPHKALVTAIIMPLHDPSQLNPERVEYWKAQQRAGIPLTAFALSVLDNQQPAMEVYDPSYKYEEQFLFTNCLLDGHHRLKAAAELGTKIRILSLLNKKTSLFRDENDLISVLRMYSH